MLQGKKKIIVVLACCCRKKEKKKEEAAKRNGAEYECACSSRSISIRFLCARK